MSDTDLKEPDPAAAERSLADRIMQVVKDLEQVHGEAEHLVDEACSRHVRMLGERAARHHAPLALWPFASDPTHEKSVLDATIWSAAPVAIAPEHAPFHSPIGFKASGHRYLVTATGLYLEVSRPWLHLIWPIHKPSAIRLPYGEVKPEIEFAFGKLPKDIIRNFAERGRTSLPNERGAWLSWEHGFDGTNGEPPAEPRLVWSDPCDTEGTPATLDYQRPEFTDHMCPAIDIHTHGAGPAGFSSIDDQDDRGDVKIAIVLGNLDRPIPSIAARLCALGLFIPIPVKAEEVFGGDA